MERDIIAMSGSMKKFIKVVSPIILILILTLLRLFGLDSISEQMTPTKAQTDTSYQSEYVYSREVFSETEYPNFYKINGNANVNVVLDEGEIVYSGFDSLGRTLSVSANLNHENFEFGKRDREDISDIYPAGWTDNKEVKLVFLDGSTYKGYLYNRSHLLAHSLGGDDAAYNLVTATRTQNVGKNDSNGGMQYAEIKAYNFLKENPDKSIYYIVTPVYNKDELIPRTVMIDMLSSDGSIDEQIEVFNVAPNFEINYMTGEFKNI